MSSVISEIMSLTEEINVLNLELNQMSDAWNGSDPFEAAASDPGLQYELSNKIDDKLKELRDFLVENVKD